MAPLELFHEARLADAVAGQKAVVATIPNDSAARLLMAELFAFAGDRSACRQQLSAIRDDRPEVAEYLGGWHALLAADEARHRASRPRYLMAPPPSIGLRAQAWDLLAAGRLDEAFERLDQSDEDAPWLEGFLDGRPFEGFREADDLLAPVLEAFVGDRYIWVPFEQIRKLRVGEAEVPRDQLWRPARVWLVDGQEVSLYIPGVYVGSAEAVDEAIQTGARLDWVERDGITRVIGGRTFLVGEDELSLDEFRQIEIRR